MEYKILFAKYLLSEHVEKDNKKREREHPVITKRNKQKQKKTRPS